ncbi:MAG: helix-turn-helix domain-containing protein [Anaerolineales bacterium]|nr:helix-turn-helix domain-containing protein [Anaerolineales bacterium]
MTRRSDLRSEYLKFIRKYIDDNHCAPRLEEIAQYFNVTKPTAHKMLSSLMKEGQLVFNRDDYSGFYIRQIEKVGTTAYLTEIVIAGGIDRFGRLHEFPKKHGHFPLVLPGYDPDKLFALQAWQHIPQADILSNDLLIFYQELEPRIGGICIIPVDDDWLIVRLVKQDENRLFFWSPVVNSEGEKDTCRSLGVTQEPITKEFVLANAIALKRTLSI